MRYILFLLLLTSCVTIQKAEKKLDSNQIESSRYCSVRFPQRDSVVTKDSISFDTLYVQGDSILIPVNVIDTISIVRPIKVQCPPTKIITKTVLHDTTIFRDNPATQARIKNLELSIAVKDSEKTRLTHGRNTWRWIGIIGSFLFVVLFALVLWSNIRKI